MSWIQENKGPAAILGLTAAGAIGLGVVWFQTWTEASASREQFDLINASITSLRSARLEPTDANLAKKQEMVTQYGALVTKLNEELLKLQPAKAPISNTDFQSKLKKKVAEIKKDAATKLPAQFNLGFDGYENELPKSDALATELSDYLDAVDAIVRLAVKSDVVGIDSLERSPLEAEKASAPTAQGAAAPGRGAPASASPNEVTRRRTVTLTLRSDQPGLQRFVSELANPAALKGFAILRLLRIENESQVGPPRVRFNAIESAETGAEAPKNGAAPAKAAKLAPAPADSKVVLGSELLRAYLEIDLVEFLAQQTSTPAGR